MLNERTGKMIDVTTDLTTDFQKLIFHIKSQKLCFHSMPKWLCFLTKTPKESDSNFGMRSPVIPWIPSPLRVEITLLQHHVGDHPSREEVTHPSATCCHLKESWIVDAWNKEKACFCTSIQWPFHEKVSCYLLIQWSCLRFFATPIHSIWMG